MKMQSYIARQKGKPLMIFNTTWSAGGGAEKTRMVALVLGVVDAMNMWHPTAQSEDTMNRFNDVLPETWPYTTAVVQPEHSAAEAVRRAILKTPKHCGLLICACDMENYKALYAELNVQTTARMI